MNDLIDDLVNSLNAKSTSATAWLQGDAACSMWGVPIPSLAFSYLIGGCSIIPCQRYMGVSGEEKSFKSTLSLEIGRWFIEAGGVDIHLDTEHKIAEGDVNTTIDALSWWNGIAEKRARVLKRCGSVSEWQKQVVAAVEFNRVKVNPRPPGERMPVFVTVDSLSGRDTDDADKNLRKEGSADERSYPIGANQTTKFLETLNMLGTTCTISWVQHMKRVLEGGTGYGPQYKEKGASAAQFSTSTHIRARAAATPVVKAQWFGAPDADQPVEGREVWLKTARTCVGPGGRTICVPLLWQYLEDDQGRQRQAMWFDWNYSLGKLLADMKYSDSFTPKLFSTDKERLEGALHFTRPTTTTIKCEELGLDKASFAEFGAAIEGNISVRDRVASFLRVTDYPSVQDADIDFTAGNLRDGKKKGR